MSESGGGEGAGEGMKKNNDGYNETENNRVGGVSCRRSQREREKRLGDERWRVGRAGVRRRDDCIDYDKT